MRARKYLCLSAQAWPRGGGCSLVGRARVNCATRSTFSPTAREDERSRTRAARSGAPPHTRNHVFFERQSVLSNSAHTSEQLRRHVDSAGPVAECVARHAWQNLCDGTCPSPRSVQGAHQQQGSRTDRLRGKGDHQHAVVSSPPGGVPLRAARLRAKDVCVSLRIAP